MFTSPVRANRVTGACMSLILVKARDAMSRSEGRTRAEPNGVPDRAGQGGHAMEIARCANGALEYEATGAGEAVLLIHGSVVAGAMAPLVDRPYLDGFRVI